MSRTASGGCRAVHSACKLATAADYPGNVAMVLAELCAASSAGSTPFPLVRIGALPLRCLPLPGDLLGLAVRARVKVCHSKPRGATRSLGAHLL
eukprot:5886081-Amphidinium_carterae.1